MKLALIKLKEKEKKDIYIYILLFGKFVPIFGKWRKDRSEYIRTIENK